MKDLYKVNIIDFNIERPQGVEDVWVTVQCRKFPTIIVGCLYRHPKSHTCTYDYIREIIHSVSLKNKSFYILGDFNDDLLSQTCKLKKLILNAKLTQLITNPTRITDNSSTLLDVIITNDSDSVIHSDTIPCPVADHELITATVNLNKPKRQPTVKTFRDLRCYTPGVLCNLLMNERHNLTNVFKTDDVERQITIFTDTFNKCVNDCAPMVTREVKRPFAPWIDINLKTLMQERNNVQMHLKNDRSNEQLRETYKTLKKQVKTLLTKQKAEYHNKKFEENKGNSAAMWDVLRQLVPGTKRNSSLTNNDDTNSKAEDFNNFFTNVGKNMFEKSQLQMSNSGDIPLPNPDIPELTVMFRPQPTDANTVILEVKHMKNSSSCGSDGIPLRYIRDSLPVIIPYVTCILNTSIVTGTFPTLWKHATVVPIFKAGDSDDPKNYRPISLLPILSKVLEKIIAKQLSQFLDENDLLSTTQHGFRSSLSTDTALLTLTNKLYQNIDNKCLSLVTLCDLSKAFDSVSHKKLLTKLTELRIDSFWFHSYLHNRTQSVRLGNTHSNSQQISYGVPQGSVLGPILFLIYVNDLSKYISDCLIIQYADDTQFVHTGNVDNIQALILKGEKTLINAKKYFNMNGLMLNTKKTQCMFVGSRGVTSRIPPNTTIRFDDSTIIPNSEVKNLGVYFDTHLTFDAHINNITRKIFSTIIFIKRLKNNFNKMARITLIKSLVLSIINYGIRIYGTANTTHLKQVQ